MSGTDSTDAATRRALDAGLVDRAFAEVLALEAAAPFLGLETQGSEVVSSITDASRAAVQQHAENAFNVILRDVPPSVRSHLRSLRDEFGSTYFGEDRERVWLLLALDQTGWLMSLPKPMHERVARVLRRNPMPDPDRHLSESDRSMMAGDEIQGPQLLLEKWLLSRWLRVFVPDLKRELGPDFPDLRERVFARAKSQGMPVPRIA